MSLKSGKRMLVVGMAYSIHVVRWLEMLQDQDWEIHVMSSFPYSTAHPAMKKVIFHSYFYNLGKNPNIEYRAFDGPGFIRNQFLSMWLGKAYRFLGFQKEYDQYLTGLINKIQPQIIHSMESQHGGYLVSRHYENPDNTLRPYWIHSTWGLDIHYFQHIGEHFNKLKTMFSHVNLFISEGERDLENVKKFDFKGDTIVFPCVAGGYKSNEFASDFAKPSTRKKIMIKGYQDNVRRGLFSVTALMNCRDLFDKYEIIVFGSTWEINEYVEYCNSKYGLSVKIYPDGNYATWLKTLTETRVLITNNLSDGNPSTLFECMFLGVLPIQSITSCADEWLTEGESGFMPDPENLEQIEKAIRMAMTDDALVDSAAVINREKVSKDLDFELIQDRAVKMYISALSKYQPTL